LVPSLPLALCGFLNSFRYHVYRSIGCFFSPFFLSFEKRKKGAGCMVVHLPPSDANASEELYEMDENSE